MAAAPGPDGARILSAVLGRPAAVERLLPVFGDRPTC